MFTFVNHPEIGKSGEAELTAEMASSKTVVYSCGSPKHGALGYPCLSVPRDSSSPVPIMPPREITGLSSKKICKVAANSLISAALTGMHLPSPLNVYLTLSLSLSLSLSAQQRVESCIHGVVIWWMVWQYWGITNRQSRMTSNGSRDESRLSKRNLLYLLRWGVHTHYVSHVTVLYIRCAHIPLSLSVVDVAD